MIRIGLAVDVQKTFRLSSEIGMIKKGCGAEKVSAKLCVETHELVKVHSLVFV